MVLNVYIIFEYIYNIKSACGDSSDNRDYSDGSVSSPVMTVMHAVFPVKAMITVTIGWQ